MHRTGGEADDRRVGRQFESPLESRYHPGRQIPGLPDAATQN
jgi:hypothetical protein